MQMKVVNVGSDTALRGTWADPHSPGKPFWSQGCSKLMNSGILCTATTATFLEHLSIMIWQWDGFAPLQFWILRKAYLNVREDANGY